MSANQQHMSLKDKIVSKLPGHKNQDANRNGIPDRLESSSSRGFSDLNRNGIPDSMERGLPLGGQPILTDLNRDGIPDQFQQQSFTQTTLSTGAPIIDVRETPAIIEKIEKPAVIHEVIKTEEVVEVQPVIEREREKLDVYEVVQPIREREVVPTEVRTAVLPAQTRAAIVEDQSAFLAQRSVPAEISTRDVAPTLHQTVQNAPIIHETIRHKVIEEVQPVIYKEVDRPVLIKETLPIYEKIVEAPHAHHTVLPMRDLGTRTVTSSTWTGASDLNRNGIPDQLESSRLGYSTGLQSSRSLSGQGYLPGQGLNSGLSAMQPNVPQGDLLSAPIVHHDSDLNRNGIPDSLENQAGLLPLQSDLNGNGIPDRMEKGLDLNGNGIDDSLERRMGSATLNSQTY